MEKELKKKDLDDLVNGCCLFASGGGGSLSSGKNLANSFGKNDRIKLVDKDTAVNDKDSYTLVIAYIGAPAAVEDLKTPEAAINAFDLMNKIVDQKIKYVVPVELGALSTIVSFAVAKSRGLSVIDGDGAGRAVPELTMLTFADKVPMPSNISNKNGEMIPSAILASRNDGNNNQRVELFVNSPTAVEEIARPFISSGIPGFDQAAGLAIWLMDSNTLEKALAITGTVSMALNVGRKLAKEGNTPADVVNYLNDHGIKAKSIFKGKMNKPIETTAGGFDMLKIVITGEKSEDNDSSNVDMHIYAQNESLIAWQTDKSYPVIIAPDSICFISEDGKVFSNADIVKTESDKGYDGKNVSVIGIPANKELLNDKSIMASFKEVLTNIGYPGNYIPLKDI